MNLMLLTVGGVTLGGLMMTMARDAAEHEMPWWAKGLIMLAGFVIVYGITQLPDLGG